jgi:peptide/nickel transport system substrate-binding protein
MSSGEEEPSSSSRWMSRRGLSTPTAAVIMIIVIVVVGGLGYVGLNATSHSGTAKITSCAPSAAPQCVSTSATHDVTLFVPYTAGFSQNLLHIAQGQNIPATVGVTGSEKVNSYSVNWGDGTTTTSANPTGTHSYTGLGTYLISATALVGSTVHDGPSQLYPVQVIPSLGNINLGYYPTISATLTNGSTGTSYQFGWIAGAGAVEVSASITGAPLNPAYTPGTPTLTSSGGVQSGLLANGTSASATYTFSNTGSTVSVNTITFVVPINGPTSGLFGNYTWTVVVTPAGLAPGCARCHVSTATSPHPGTIDVYEVAPGGGASLDPSVDYETTGFEVISNVYQSLINYNGTQTGPSYTNYQPEAATCVPGSPQCAGLYGGNTLQSGNYYTFVINPTSRFYDPSSGKSWPVYPSDVVFSLARTMGFSLLPGFGSNPGWIQTQSLLPAGNGLWDGGIHGTFNNTPGPILSSMFVNDTSPTLGGAACPAIALTSDSGCVTFNATGGGHPWPFFLELIVDDEGAGIEPCGWFTANGAGVPGFTPTGGADSPCLLPGGATSTSQSSFQTYLSNAFANPTEWDSFEEAAENSPAINPGVQWNTVGSGPYYLVPNSANPAVGYTLKANPAYGAPTCAGQPGCDATPGHYAGTVNVFWEASDQIGYEQYIAGYADFADLQTPDIGNFLTLANQGKIGLTTAPTLDINFFPFTLEFSTTASTDLGVTVNVPQDFFASEGVRNFLTTAYPYTTIENTINTVDGIQFGFNYGGAIPQFMANYYPQNISWPDSNPVSSPSTVGSAAWWWTQLTTPGSLWYDSEVAACTTSAPCIFPIVGQKGATNVDDMIVDWTNSIVSLTGGRFQPDTVDLTFAAEVGYSIASGPGGNPMPLYILAWAPDYPDPTDYMAPLYYPDSTYTYSDALQETLDGTYSTPTTFNATWCGHTADTWADLIYWANGGPANDSGYLPNACQYSAYQVMTYFMVDVAATDANLVERNLIYNLAEHIAAQMGLYIYQAQANAVATYAGWIDPSTIDRNVTTGGGPGFIGGVGLFSLIGGYGVW